MRKVCFGPAAVAVATLLTVFASLGLHPEPGDGAAATASVAGPVAQASDHAVRSTRSHDCQICLTHRTVSLSSLQHVVFDRGTAVFASPRKEPSLRGLAVTLLRDGRAPPSA